MELLTTSAHDLDRAARALRDGFLVAIPTETVYGLGADARNTVALARVFEAKRRPSFDPLIVHVADPEDAPGVADLSVRYAAALAERFWPGPLTMVLPKNPTIPDLATSGLPTVAVRCPANVVAREIIRRAGVPVAAPSANPFGYLSPTRAGHVVAQLGSRVDYIVDGGRCSVGVESTVVDLSCDPPLVLRPGGLPVELIATVIPSIEVFDRSTTSPRAPGQLPSHYAPVLPLHLVDAGGLSSVGPAVPAVAICFGSASAEREAARGVWVSVVDLSPAREPVEAAARLFDVLHALDSGASVQASLRSLSPSATVAENGSGAVSSGTHVELWAERLPDQGLGRAVNDRLYKASVK